MFQICPPCLKFAEGDRGTEEIPLTCVQYCQNICLYLITPKFS